MAKKKNIIITCAVTGSIYTPTMSDHLPVTGSEIATAAIDAADAGASIVHLHARDPENGRPSAKVDDFMGFIPQIHQATDAVLNISTGGSSLMTLDQRLAPARHIAPEMCSLNMGAMNFGIFTLKDRYDDWKHDWEPELLNATRSTTFKNTYEDIDNILSDLGDGQGAKFEFECYDMGHIDTLGYYLKTGKVKAPLYIQFVMGVMGGIGASPENLMAMKNHADRVLGPENFEFSVLGAGLQQIPLATMAVILGGNVRVGLEDSLIMPDKQLATSNAAQVQKIRTIIKELGYNIAEPDEARERLGLKGRDKINATK
ncbi:3-keto-5-aminohexanoate cleavage protein [Pseudemcibacter aquimaris]|uniref:3-keto-5-aminohexanoate cleavage protein n=1 Tax=Pseudemcibacter aquimaris TaxID=2857064 RepID=UPI0020139A02|nr:3-keto-5-aminohexanoate cleavage protein [Pseudemcibacter aquimaris]MCC3859993.1 3-keto-5-aminohexanoate cleavage protein [Pseudemcibacter aquimaris]WDU57324.1 3-keto-5-aminohexanoate cleavage protein [Pseudemcibacter aquimaris]